MQEKQNGNKICTNIEYLVNLCEFLIQYRGVFASRHAESYANLVCDSEKAEFGHHS